MIGDFNGDGKDDIFLQGKTSSSTHYKLLSDGTGGFTGVESWQNGHQGLTWSADQVKIVSDSFVYSTYDSLFIQAANGVNAVVVPNNTTGSLLSPLEVHTNVNSDYFAIVVEPEVIERFTPSATSFGAVKGSFDTHAGAATYSIPIDIPKGIGEVQPNLSLNYSSSGSNGLLGVGWSLGGLSSISRCSQNYAQDGNLDKINFDANDRLCLDGQRLIAVNGAYGAVNTEYRTEMDSFSRITGMGADFNDVSKNAWFKVETKSGLILEYGKNANAQSRMTLGDGTVVIRSWAVNKTSDVVGNYYTVEYNQDVAAGEHYPHKINYTYNDTPGSEIPSTSPALFSVLFSYQGRIDAYSGYFNTGKVNLSKRLSAITTTAGGETSAVRHYYINYETDGHSNLSRVDEVYECDADNNCKPPIRFDWENGQRWPTVTNITTHCADSACYNGGESYNSVRYADVNGDGYLDMCYRHSSGIRCAKGTQTGLESSTFINTDICADNSTAHGGCDDKEHYKTIQYVDVNADGMADITYRGDAGIQIILSTGTGFNTANRINTGIYPTSSACIYTGLSDDNGPICGTAIINNQNRIFWADLNGDALADMCYRKPGYDANNNWIGGSGLKCFINTNSGNYLSQNPDPGYDTNYCDDTAVPNGCNSSDNFDTITFIDMNADGKSDLVYRADSGIEYHVSTGTGFGTTYSTSICDSPFDPGTYSCKGDDPGFYTSIRYPDINGDSLPDICWRSDDGIRCVHGTGAGFNTANQIKTNICNPSTAPNIYGICNDNDNLFTIQFVDLNGDGKHDLTYRGDSGVQSWLSNGSGFYDWTSHGGIMANGVNSNNVLTDFNNIYTIQYPDINGDGMADMAFRSDGGVYTIISNGVKGDLLSVVTDSLDNQTQIAYKTVSDTSIHTPCSGASYPETCGMLGGYVIASYDASNGVGGMGHYSFHYTGLRTHLRGRARLGFASIGKLDSQTMIESKTHYDNTTNVQTVDSYPDLYPYLGMIKESTNTSYNSTTVELSKTTNTLAYKGTYGTMSRPIFPYFSNSVEFKRDLNTGADITRTDITNYFDQGQTHHAGNLTRTLSVTTDLTNPTEHTEVSFSKDVVNVFADDVIDASTWHLGRLTATTVTHSSSSDTKVKQSTFDYRADGLLLETIEEPGTPDLKVVTTYGYDTYGNKNSVQKAGDATASHVVETRSSSSNYEAGTVNSLTPQVRSINALGHNEVKTLDARFGVNRYLLGPNGLTTEWLYDSFGRQTREVRADGTYTETTREFCSSCLAVETIAPSYKVTTRTYGNGASTLSPPVISYFDKLGRELRTETTAVDGQVIYTDTVYNSKGQVQKQSRPYFVGDTIYWTHFEYDVVGRVTRELQDGGSEKLITYAPLLNTVTVKNLSELNQTVRDHIKKTYSYANGKTRKVEENKDATTFVSSTYAYDALGNLTQVNPPNSAPVLMNYDLMGRKISMTDPDMGGWNNQSWTYEHDALGNLRKQISASGVITVNLYDKLDRKVLRIAPSEVTVWEYDTAGMGIGKLHKVTGPIGLTTAQHTDQLANPSVANALALEASYHYKRTHSYSVWGLPANTVTRMSGIEYHMDTSYDVNNRVDAITYPENVSSTTGSPNRLSVRNVYDSNGFMVRIENAADNSMLWQLGDNTGSVANAINASGQIEVETRGNGLTTVRGYRPMNGYLSFINTGSGLRQNLVYTFDSIGNLEQRVDQNQLDLSGQSISETFSYDHLNRLKTVSLSNIQGTAVNTYDYDDNGNMIYNSGFGTYVYDPAATAASGPHAVDRVLDGQGQVLNQYTYDVAGNMTSDNNRTINYSFFNKPLSILGTNQAGNSFYNVFNYGPDRARYQQFNNNGNVIYLGKQFERETAISGQVTDTHYLFAGKTPIGTYVVEKDTASIITTKNEYFLLDHLGSVDVVTDAQGAVVTQQSFGAFGQRRNLDWSVSTTMITVANLRRGFTGHEHLDDAGLIHMNGRVYDPMLARFMSADPFVQEPYSTQSYNRYSYVFNNPLSYTDPTGYLTGRDAVKIGARVAIAAAMTFTGGALGSYWGQSMFWASVGAAAGSSFATYAMTGDGQLAAYSFLTAMAFYGVGHSGLFAEGWQQVVGHGVVGGLSHMAQGGKFVHGFIASAFTKYIEGDIGSIGDGEAWGAPARIVTAAVVGGTTSVIAGGKFANGAIAGAFARAFNDEMTRRQKEPTFTDALRDKEFWKIYAQKVKQLGFATGKMLLGEASFFSGWILSKIPGGQITGAYLMVDGSSLFAGGMSDVSNMWYGISVNYDFVGVAYRSAGEYYFGNATYGDIARSSMGLGAIFRANTIPVQAVINASTWGNSALTYTKTVPAFYTSNNTLRAFDAVGVVQGARSLYEQ